MGIDYHTYIGPYIKVCNPLKDSTEKYHTCTNSHCKNYKEELFSKFCPECGREVWLQSRPSQTRIVVDYWDKFGGSITEADLCDDNFNWFIPNIGKIGKHLDSKYTHHRPVEYKHIKSDMNNFKFSFKKQLTHINKTFGKKNVTLEWGVLVYQS